MFKSQNRTICRNRLRGVVQHVVPLMLRYYIAERDNTRVSGMVREEMTAGDVKRLLANVGQGPFDEFVGGVPGLSLRGRATGASWVLRGRVRGVPTVRTWTLGDGLALSLSSARARAGVALDMARQGQDPAEWLGQQSGKPIARTATAAATTSPQESAWAWEYAVERYLALNEPTWRAATHGSHRRNLCHPDVVSALGGRLLRDIKAENLARLQNSFADRGKRSMARAVSVSVGGLLRWCAGRPEAGLPKERMRELLDVDRIVVAPPPSDGRVPSDKAMGELPWLLSGAGFQPRMRFAVMLVALTAQRVRTVREAETSHVDGGTWAIPGRLMKSGRPHRLPLPPLTAACFEALRGLAGDSKWLFPQAGGKAPTTYRPFREAVGGAVPGHGPHALRRAFATHGDGLLNLSLRAIGMILDHEDPGITRRHYALHERRDITTETLLAWERWLVERMVASRPSGAPAWPAWLPRPSAYD